eukprot:gene692-384_t
MRDVCAPQTMFSSIVLAAVAGAGLALGAAPRFSWENMTGMVFFHACNESGMFNDQALDTIQKFPLVTIEKGQGFNDGTGRHAEAKIVEQCAAVKARNKNISTVFYINEVLDWYFYAMADTYKQNPEWWLRYSKAPHLPYYTAGDRTFNPPKGGMLVFDHSKQAVRDFWLGGFVDGIFTDSSQGSTHGTEKALNSTDQAAFEAGKVLTSSNLTAHFGGKAGAPYVGSTGVLIGKKPDQLGINAYQIEFFTASEDSIAELQAGVKQGYLVQAHTHSADTCGCSCMNDTAAAFLIGAGPYSYYGSGEWIAQDLDDVQRRWCPPIFERPLGAPTGDAVKGSDGIYRRSFSSGTKVEFDTKTNHGNIQWAS